MKIKICGITCLEDALFADEKGAWAIGFNFYKSSLRYIEIEKAEAIHSQLSNSIIKVGIFIESLEDEILKGFEFLDLIQVYEDFELPLVMKKRMIFVVQSENEGQLPSRSILDQYGYILLDAPKRADGLLGGTGRLANWKLAKKLAQDYKLILAGGLNERNVEEAIKIVQPFGVDVASGVEKFPGIKNQEAMEESLRRCKNEK